MVVLGSSLESGMYDVVSNAGVHFSGTRVTAGVNLECVVSGECKTFLFGIFLEFVPCLFFIFHFACWLFALVYS